MQIPRCPLCGHGLSKLHTEDVYQCHCGEFSITGEEIVTVQPAMLKQVLRAKLIRCVDIALNVGEKSGFPLAGIKNKDKWSPKWASYIIESTPSVNSGWFGEDLAYSADPLLSIPWEVKPVPKLESPKYLQMKTASVEAMYKKYMAQMMGLYETGYSPKPPKAKAEIVPKESVKLDSLTPALQEFMKDYTK